MGREQIYPFQKAFSWLLDSLSFSPQRTLFLKRILSTDRFSSEANSNHAVRFKYYGGSLGRQLC